MGIKFQGAVNWGSGFNITGAAPIDARMIVETATDLWNAKTWDKNTNPPYDGMTVTVADTGDIYILTNAKNLDIPFGTTDEVRGKSPWKKLEASQDVTGVDGKISAAINALDVKKIASTKQAVVAVWENDGKVESERGNINSEFVDFKDAEANCKIIKNATTGTTTNAALKDLDAQVEVNKQDIATNKQDISDINRKFVTHVHAGETYLTKADAAASYFTLAKSVTYEGRIKALEEADKTFLTKADAAASYFTLAKSVTYEGRIKALEEADKTFLTKADAAASYFTLATSVTYNTAITTNATNLGTLRDMVTGGDDFETLPTFVKDESHTYGILDGSETSLHAVVDAVMGRIHEIEDTTIPKAQSAAYNDAKNDATTKATTAYNDAITYSTTYTTNAINNIGSKLSNEYVTHAHAGSTYLAIADAVGKKTKEGGEIFNDYVNNTAAKNSHTEGINNKVSSEESHAEGTNNTVTGVYVDWAGKKITDGKYNHVEGDGNTVNGRSNHAEGSEGTITGDFNHIEGGGNEIIPGEDGKGPQSSHAEGQLNVVKASHAHAEGSHNKALGVDSHVEGYYSTATGGTSHAEGGHTNSIGPASHAEGQWTNAIGEEAHAEGHATIAYNQAEHAQGIFNYSTKGVTLSSIGFGPTAESRKNAVEVTKTGLSYFAGIGQYDGKNVTAAKSLQEVINAKAEASKLDDYATIAGLENGTIKPQEAVNATTLGGNAVSHFATASDLNTTGKNLFDLKEKVLGVGSTYDVVPGWTGNAATIYGSESNSIIEALSYAADAIVTNHTAYTQGYSKLNGRLTKAESDLVAYNGRIEKVEALEIVKLAESNGVTKYQLKSGKDKYGVDIDVPTAQIFQKAELGWSDSTVDPATGKITHQKHTDKPEVLILVFITPAGKYEKVPVDLESFLSEAEFKNGLIVDPVAHTVNVRVAEADSKTPNFLTMEGTEGEKALAVRNVTSDFDILPKDLVVAGLNGNTIGTGAITNGKTYKAGTSVYQILLDLLVKEIYPTTKEHSGSLTFNGNSLAPTLKNAAGQNITNGKLVEIGDVITLNTVQAKVASLNTEDVNYVSGFYKDNGYSESLGGVIVKAASISKPWTDVALSGNYSIKSEITKFGGTAPIGTTPSTNASTVKINEISLGAVKVGANTIKVVETTPSGTGSCAEIPALYRVSNLGNRKEGEKTAKVPAKTKVTVNPVTFSGEISVTGVYPVFSNASNVQYTDATNTKIKSGTLTSSADIKYPLFTGSTLQVGAPTEVVKEQRIIVYYPANKTISKVEAVGLDGKFGPLNDTAWNKKETDTTKVTLKIGSSQQVVEYKTFTTKGAFVGNMVYKLYFNSGMNS